MPNGDQFIDPMGLVQNRGLQYAPGDVTGYAGTLALRMQLLQRELDQPNMYLSPYQPTLVQQAAVFGSGMLGYQNPTAMPQVSAGQSIYNEVTRARTTTPLFNQMNQNFNRRMGQMFGSTMAQAGSNMGLQKNMSDGEWNEKFIRGGESGVGQMLSGMAQQTAPVQMLMGGDLRQSYSSMFANRNFLAFGAGQLVNPNSKTQQQMGAQYANMLADDVIKQVYTDDNGRFSPLVPNMRITRGRDVGQIGEVANMIASMDPRSRGMSQESYRIMDKATRQARQVDAARAQVKNSTGKDATVEQIADIMNAPIDAVKDRIRQMDSGQLLNATELSRVKQDVNKFTDRVVKTVEALGEIGDAIGSSDLIKTADQVNQAFQGRAFNMSPEALKAYGQQLSAGEKVYGVSAGKQMAMHARLGTAYAAATGAINPITGKVDSDNVAMVSSVFNQYALNMASEQGITPEDALRYTEHQVQVATRSRAGRASKLIEAGYRTGRLSEAQYKAFITASSSGDIRKQGDLLKSISNEMYGSSDELFAAMQDPTRMRIAEQQLNALPPEERMAATTALAGRILEGPQQEARRRAADISMKNADRLAGGVLRMAGVSARTANDKGMTDVATFEGYRGYLESQQMTLDPKDPNYTEKKEAIDKKLALLDATHKRGGMRAVKSMVGSMEFFRADKAEMEASGSQAVVDRRLAAAERAFSTVGVAGQWLSDAWAASSDDPEMRKKINTARKLLQKDPAAAQNAIRDIYSSMGGELRAAIGDPAAKSATAANMLKRARLEQQTSQLMTRLSDPEARAAVQQAMKDDPSLSYQDAISKVVGKPVGAMSAYQTEALARAGAEMGLASEQLFNAPSKKYREQTVAALQAQMGTEAEVNRANEHLKMNVAQRALKFFTQDKDAAGRLSMLDVIGVSTDERKAATGDTSEAMVLAQTIDEGKLAKMSDRTIEKKFGALGAERVAAIKYMRDQGKGIRQATKGRSAKDGEKAFNKYLGTEGKGLALLGSGPVDAATLAEMEKADKLNTAMSEALGGDTSKLEALAAKQADKLYQEEGHKRHWWKPDGRYNELKAAATERLTDMARSGKTYTAGDMPTVRDRLAMQMRGDALGNKDKDASTTKSDKMRIVLESANLTIDMGGQRRVGTLGGEGYGE